MGPVRQRPDRPHGGSAGAPDAGRKPRRRWHQHLRHTRCGHRHRGPIAARLRHRQRRQRGVEIVRDAATDRRCDRPADRLPADQSRQRQPLLPFSIFRLRHLRGADIVGVLLGMSLFSMFFFISLYLQEVLHYSPIKTGIAYLPLAVGIIISAGLASQVVTRIGFRPTLIAGLLLVAGGLVWFSRVPAPGGSYVADVLGPSLLAAAGFGFAFVSVTIATVTGTRPHEAGLASGLINTTQQIGGALGLAILRVDRQQPHPEPLPLWSPQRLRCPDQGVRPGVLGGRRLRPRRCDPGLRADRPVQARSVADAEVHHPG